LKRNRWPVWSGISTGSPPQVNRGKKSLALNLKSDEAKEIVYKLLGEYYIVLEQFRPGVMERLGLGYDRLKRGHPRGRHNRKWNKASGGKRMSSPDFSRKVKQSVAATFDQSFAIYQDFEDKHHFFAELAAGMADWIGVRPGSRVLDLGCGNGISARVLCERCGCRVLGIDLSPKMVEAGQRLLSGLNDVRLVVGDGELPGEVAGDERFDYVLYNASIFVFPDVDRAVREAAACLKADGEIAFSFYPALLGPNDEDLMDEAFRRTGYPPPKFRVITSYEAACKALADHRGPVSHYRWARPLDVGFLKDFFSIPAQSASLFPGLEYEERKNRVNNLLDSIADTAGTMVWRMAKA